MKSISLLGAPISTLGFDAVFSACKQRIAARLGGYVCFANVHTVTESTRHPALAQALQKAWLSVADGLPLVWTSRLKHTPIDSRVCGPDLMRELSQVLSAQGTSQGLLGGAPGVAETLVHTLHLQNTVCLSPPHRSFSRENALEDWAQFLQLCPSGQPPAIVWVGLGAPKQELWCEVVSSVAPHTLFMAVGAAFDFLSGTKRRAPVWMQNAGLEWFYRLSQEPGRLARRYLVTNTEFIAKMSAELVRESFYKKA